MKHDFKEALRREMESARYYRDEAAIIAWHNESYREEEYGSRAIHLAAIRRNAARHRATVAALELAIAAEEPLVLTPPVGQAPEEVQGDR